MIATARGKIAQPAQRNAAITLGIGWKEFLVIVGTATGVAVLKVIIGQNTGQEATGSLIGKSVIEP